jgi:GMP synthase-like glutamine amidotransferase
MGGYMGANDDIEFPWLIDARSLMKDVVANDIPFFGICLGGQLLAAAIDGKVGPTPVPEIGVASFRVTADAATDSVFGHLAGKDVIAAEWHKDYITDLPDDAVVLAGNDVCPVQAFRMGENVYGVQFHPEIDSEIFSSWAATDDELAKLDHTIEQACQQVASAEAELIKTWKPAFQAWAQLVKDQKAGTHGLCKHESLPRHIDNRSSFGCEIRIHKGFPRSRCCVNCAGKSCCLWWP